AHAGPAEDVAHGHWLAAGAIPKAGVHHAGHFVVHPTAGVPDLCEHVAATASTAAAHRGTAAADDAGEGPAAERRHDGGDDGLQDEFGCNPRHGGLHRAE